MLNKYRQQGFTIVELLIVVVVIGILATIAIVSYNGISKRAVISTLQNDLSGVATVLQNDKTVDGSANFPSDLSGANGGKGLKASNGASYQYTVDNTVDPRTYCITETKGLVSYYIDQTGVIKEGYCAGHVAPADNTAVVTTLAGSSRGYADGTGSSAQFFAPSGITVDSSGTIYVSDTWNYRIRKVTSSGTVTTIAGSGVAGPADGTGTGAQFNFVQGLVVDSSGTIYVADSSNHRIRKMTSSGVVTTIAGSTQGYADGTGTAAQFNNPQGIALDSSGNLWIADTGNHRIRKMTSSGVVTTVAGSTQGYADGTGTATQFDHPYGVAVDAAGTAYVADPYNQRIRKITSGGVVTTIAGSAEGYLDGTGVSAKFSYPGGVVVTSSGTLYVTEFGTSHIRKITSAGVVTTLAGGSTGYADGTGTNAQFANISSIALSSDGILYVTDYNNNRIRKIQIP